MGTDPNHAYIPKRGVHTAWRALLPRLFSEKNIYEFDLKGFFPNVDISEIGNLLVSELKVPKRVADYLTSINRSVTNLQKEDLLDESNDRKVLLTPSGKANPNLPTELKAKVERVLEERGCSKEHLSYLLPDDGWTLYREVGVPQGAGTSCCLSTISLIRI